MIRSLLAVEPAAQVWVLALTDSAMHEIHRRFGSEVHIVGLKDFEDLRPDIAATRSSRTRMEYVFTCTAGWLRFVMDKAAADGDWVTYLDADLFFYGSPASIYEAMEVGSVGIVPHRFPWFRSRLRKYGTFNVGWVSFRADDEGRRCLDWWDTSCVEWCFDRVDQGKFADQGYLDALPSMSRRTVVLGRPGVNLAPWNLGRHKITCESGRLVADGDPVVFFHFHGISRHEGRYYLKDWYYGARASKVIKDCIYRPYLARMAELDKESGPSGDAQAGRTSTVGVRLRRVVARCMRDTVRLARD